MGNTLKEGLATLLDEITGEMDTAKIGPALESIVRLRAVQDFTTGPGDGLRFRATENPVTKTWKGGSPHTWQKRIDETALLAFDLYMRCREEIYEIRAREHQREVYVWERMCHRAKGEST